MTYNRTRKSGKYLDFKVRLYYPDSEVRLSSELHALTVERQRKVRSDSVENRERVLAAARVVFAEHGMDALIPDVAALAGVGKGTVYRHFPTKESLMQALLDDYWRNMELLLKNALAGDDPWLGFVSLITGIFTIKAEHRAACDIMMASPTQRPSTPLSGRLNEALTTLFERAQAAGSARRDVPVQTMPVMVRSLSAAVKASHELGVDWQPYVNAVLDGLHQEA
ncbi:MAG: TetR family transcriptional regulator [Chloroflexi bacterium]|nr:TetR family transcriptional regulator [Chloroflexota bacterium]